MKYCPECASPLVKAMLGGRERDACPDPNCGFVNWDNPRPVVAAIVQYEDQIILVRNVGWPAHWYGLITGFLEAEEMPEEAVLREVREEVGLEATLESFIGMYEFYRMNQLIIAYHVTVRADNVVIDPEEIADYKIIPINKVRPWTAGTGRALNDWLMTLNVKREPVDFDKARN